MEQKDYSNLSEGEKVEEAVFSTDPKLLEILATDSSTIVRALVSINPNTPKETLEEMKKNDNEWVKLMMELR